MLSGNKRPLLHFTPAFGWMNDPNGLIYHQGQYHLFYQHHPFNTQWGPMHWGHAVSHDLTHWTHYPIALKPDEQGMCFSGTAVSDKNNRSGFFEHDQGLLAFFTLAGEKKPSDPDYPQSQGVAFSHDHGLSWQKYAGNPILPNTELQDFRDPKVFWYEPNACWIMVVTLGQSVGIYRSENALDWTKLSSFGEAQGKHDERAWECPDLFPLTCVTTGKEYWILVVSLQRSAFYPTSGGVQYFIGHFDGHTFSNLNTAETVLWLDYGKDFYAAQTWTEMPENDPRRIILGWMASWPYGGGKPADDWRSMMSFPRQLHLVETLGRMEISHSFVNELNDQLIDKSVGFPRVLTSENMQSYSVMTPYRLRMKFSLLPQSEFSLSLTDDLSLSVSDSGLDSLLVINRSTAETESDFDRQFAATCELVITGTEIDLDILVDRCSVEILVNNGKYACSFLSYPTTHIQTIDLKTMRGIIQIKEVKLDAYQASISSF